MASRLQEFGHRDSTAAGPVKSDDFSKFSLGEQGYALPTFDARPHRFSWFRCSEPADRADRTKEVLMLRRCSGFFTGVFVLLLALPAFGQGGRAEINGTVID